MLYLTTLSISRKILSHWNYYIKCHLRDYDQQEILVWILITV